MKIPKTISKNRKKYMFVKRYPNFIMYRDMLTGIKECFTYHELGLVKKQSIHYGRINNIKM